MKTTKTIFSLAGILLLFANSGPWLAAQEKSLRIPRINNLVVDGSGEDWEGQGYRVAFLTDPEGRILPVDDFDAKFRIGWNPQGLFIFAEVGDDIPSEHESRSRLWRKDCLELFVSEKDRTRNHYQLVLASGADQTYKRLRTHFYDGRPDKENLPELQAQIAGRIIAGGYQVEVLLPWENLGIAPEAGTELAFQFVANDDDGEDDASGPLRLTWFPGITAVNWQYMKGLRLSEKADEPEILRVDRNIGWDKCEILLRGSAEVLDRQVTIRERGKIAAEGRFKPERGRAGLSLPLLKPQNQAAWPGVEVFIDGKKAASFEAVNTLKTIRDRYIGTVGSRKNWESLSTRICRGEWIYNYDPQNPQNQGTGLDAFAALPDKWMADLKVSKGQYREGSDGVVGWRVNADRIERIDNLKQARFGLILNPGFGLVIQDLFPYLRLIDKVVIAGRNLFRLKPEKTNWPHGELYFDADSGLLVRIGENWELHDYREVDGILFPFRLVVGRSGGTGAFVFERVTHNTPIENQKFAMPDHEEVFPEAFEGIDDPVLRPMLTAKDLTYVHEDMNVPCRDGRFLHDFILKHDYRRGLEIGTFTGYSTLWMGLALRKTGGKIYTIEIDEGPGRTARESFRKAGLEEVIDARIADAFEVIPEIEGSFDFVFIDAWKPDYLKFLKLLRGRIEPGGAIIAHNVTNYARDMREFLEAVKNDPGLETTFNELSGEGMSISIVKKSPSL